MGMMKQFRADQLHIRIFASPKRMGAEAAKDVANRIKAVLVQRGEVNIVFAAAPSQNEFLWELTRQQGIDWGRVNAFHMDEYLGLSADAPQDFGNFLKARLFERLPFKSVFYLNGQTNDMAAECKRYTSLLKSHPIDIVCMGIGENGHIAFNDPHAAFFNDPEWVKTVTLDQACRMQQVNDGCFENIDQVPTQAITLTVPALMSAAYVFCIVPTRNKERAVFDSVRGPVCETCPASILRTHANAELYLDCDSGKRLLFRRSVITDEVSQDPVKAAQLAKKYGLEALEIRSVWDKESYELTDEEAGRLKAIAHEYGLTISAVCGPVFKCDINDSHEVDAHFQILQKCIALAKILDVKIIRAFTFWAGEDFDDQADTIAKMISKAIPLLEKDKIILAIENDPSVYASNARKLARIVKKINSPYVGILWDPGNELWNAQNETPYPDGYRIVKPHVVHVHIKDAIKTGGEKTIAVRIGDGQVDYQGQLAALLEDGYDGFIALETHYRIKHEISDDIMRLPKGTAFSYKGHEATEECLAQWDLIINEVKTSVCKQQLSMEN